VHPTRQRVRDILDENPEQTFQSIADRIGRTKERVRQIISAEGWTKTKPPSMSKGVEKTARLSLVCANPACGKTFLRLPGVENAKKRLRVSGPTCSKRCTANLATHYKGGPPRSPDGIAIDSLGVLESYLCVSACRFHSSFCYNHSQIHGASRKRTGHRYYGRHTDQGFVVTRIE